MAYGQGYQGGYADTLVPPPPVEEPGGEYLHKPKPRRRDGTATIRLTVATSTSGNPMGRAEKKLTVAPRTLRRAGQGRATVPFGVHIGDPKEDERLVAMMLAALLDELDEGDGP